MELKWPWLVLVLAAVVVVLLVAWIFPSFLKRSPRRALVVAHVQRMRRVPRFRSLARRRILVGSLRTLAVLVLIAGTVLLAGRVTEKHTESRDTTHRDILLCLDVSGSMTTYDAELIAEFRKIAEGLEGERIGLTIWDGASVTIFPLTDDHEFVLDQLDIAGNALRTGDYDFTNGTYVSGGGLSLIGDGLASCVQRFDQLGDDERGRAIVMATDNAPNGKSVFTLPEAAQLAADKDIRVYGLGTSDLEYRTDEAAEFREAVEVTDGKFAVMGEPDSVENFVAGIEELEEAHTEKPPKVTITDEPWWGAGLVSVGIGLVVLTGVGRRA